MKSTHGTFTVGVPHITCAQAAWDKLIGYSKCKALIKGTENRKMVEISGLGVALQEDLKTFHIQDFHLLPSTGSAASTEIDNDGMAALAMELMASDTPEDVSNMRVWWHTHPGMGLTWSSQDVRQMVSFGTEAKFPWLISIVTNEDGGYRCRLDLFEEMKIRTWFDGLAIEVIPDNALLQNLQAEVDEKVEVEKVLVIPHGSNCNYGYKRGGTTGFHFKDKRRVKYNYHQHHRDVQDLVELDDISDATDYMDQFNALMARDIESSQADEED